MIGTGRDCIAPRPAPKSIANGTATRLGKSRLTVIRPHSPAAARRDTSSTISRMDVCILSLQFEDFRSRDFWADGQPLPVMSFSRAAASRVHVDFAPLGGHADAFDGAQFRDAEVAPIEGDEDCGPHDIDAPGIAVHDPVVRQLEACLLQGLQRPNNANSRFLDHVIQALHAHCAEIYGGVRRDPSPSRGGLAPWQERRAKEFMQGHLHEDVCLTQVAGECRLSPSHFARAFRRSTGLPPHRWLLERRVEKAKDLMLASALPLAEIALSCGFADQSHLNRVFTQRIGTTPRAWRRAQEV